MATSFKLVLTVRFDRDIIFVKFTMDLEKMRRYLDLPPLKDRDQRTEEKKAEAERATTAPVNEYVSLREEHLQRVIFETLTITGLPSKTSTKLAHIMLETHRKMWQTQETRETTEALSTTRIPIAPFKPEEGLPKFSRREEERQRRRLGNTVAHQVFLALQDSKIPDLTIAPEKISR